MCRSKIIFLYLKEFNLFSYPLNLVVFIWINNFKYKILQEALQKESKFFFSKRKKEKL
jgi:hypothetical protein